MDKPDEKPTGTFKCPVCQQTWDGSQLTFSSRRHYWACGDVFCGAQVRKISEVPKPGTSPQEQS